MLRAEGTIPTSWRLRFWLRTNSLYDDGQDVPQDYAKAREWYEKAAAGGNTDSMNNLVVLYDNGPGVPQDLVKANDWFEKATTENDYIAEILV